jgi:hypothetical protein
MVLEKIAQKYCNKIQISPEAVRKELSALDIHSKGALKLESQWIRDQSTAHLKVLKSVGKYAALDKLYQRIDMSFLGDFTIEQNGLVLPKLAVFTPEVDVASVWYQAGWSPGLRCNIASVLEYQSSQTVESMKELCDKELLSQVAATVSWGGRIPDASRAIIQNAQGQFDEVLIVAEINEWKITKKVHPLLFFGMLFEASISSVLNVLAVIGDPLVIGRRGDIFWLVHEFDTTELESCLAREFLM